MAFPRLLSMSPHVIGVGFLVGYVVLDWLSFVHPYGPFGITPWNPATGLSIVLVSMFGLRHLPMLFIGPLLADIIVRGLPAGWLVSLLGAAIFGAGWSAAALFLLKPSVRFDVSLSSMRDLFLLMVVAVASAAAVALAYVALHAATDHLHWSDFAAAALRFWIGDVVGVAVLTPFLLILLTRGQPFEFGREAALQVALILLCLAIVFGLSGSRNLQLFYLLFLPIVWIAVRAGLEGVSAGLVITQLCLMLAMQTRPGGDIDVTAFQALMLVLAVTGLAAGVLVTERRRAELQLRLQQDAQARLTRLGSMGELASALAHEINQPLMAAGTYTRLAADAIAGGGSPAKASEVAAKAVAQVERAAEVVRRLRDLIRLGRSERAPVTVPRMVDETLELLQSEIDGSGIRIERRLPADLPLVMADALQVEQVLLNIVRNAIEAIRGTGATRGRVDIEAAMRGPEMVEISVRDDGPGFSEASAAALLPLASSKPEGLGVGIALSRSIIQAHGGSLEHGNTATGAVVRFTLPIAEAAE
jgi:signal transduction histidine kinase